MANLMRRCAKQNRCWQKNMASDKTIFDNFEEELKQLHAEEVLVKSKRVNNERTARLKVIRERIKVLESTIKDLETKISANNVLIAEKKVIVDKNEKLFFEKFGETIQEYRRGLIKA